MRKYVIIGTKEQEKRLRILNKREDFQILFDFLVGHEACILREIKKEISLPKLERLLEECIETGIVRRANRRYTANLTEAFPAHENEGFMRELEHLREKYDKEERTIGLFLFLRNFPFAPAHALVVKKGSVAWAQLSEIPVARTLKAPVSQLMIGELVFEKRPVTYLSRYFEKLEKEEALNARENAVYRLIQDVSPDYAAHAFALSFLKCLEMPAFSTGEPDIFLQALVQSDFFKQDGNEFSLNVPILSLPKKNLFYEEITQVFTEKTPENYNTLTKVFQDVVYPHFLVEK